MANGEADCSWRPTDARLTIDDQTLLLPSSSVKGRSASRLYVLPYATILVTDQDNVAVCQPRHELLKDGYLFMAPDECFTLLPHLIVELLETFWRGTKCEMHRSGRDGGCRIAS